MSLCTVEKRGNVYILTITGDDEHRLNPTLMTSIRSSLSQIKSHFLKSNTPSSALITTAQGKFFSNGFDLDTGNSNLTKEAMNTQLKTLYSHSKPLLSDLISFPMPTIAAVNGHVAAAGCILAIAHDYVVMRRDRGYFYMSELDVGLVIPSWGMALVRSKMGGNWGRRRRVVLMAEKVTAKKAKSEIGVVDEVFDGVQGTVDGAVRLAEELAKKSWDGVVYAEKRKVLLKDALDLIMRNDNDDDDDDDDDDGGGGNNVKIGHEVRPRL